MGGYMTALSGDDSSFKPIEQISIAGFWRRLAAFAIDGLILGLPTLLLGLAFFQWAASLGQAGHLLGFFVALIYYGIADSRICGGQTIGKRLLGIRVMDRTGNFLSPIRSALRFMVWAIPFFLNGIWFDVDPSSITLWQQALGVLLVFVVFGGLATVVYLFIFNRHTRQSLQDIAVGSFVVRDSSVGIPISLSTPRLHLIVTSCLLAVAFIGPIIGLVMVSKSNLPEAIKPLVELQNAIKDQIGVQQARATMGSTFTATVGTGTATITFLQFDTRTDLTHRDANALQLAVASKVIELRPDLLGKQILIVQVQQGFDFGIAAWNVNNRGAFDVASWKLKLSQNKSF
jgi:uncharacterized RDD family membrane protein YckC